MHLPFGPPGHGPCTFAVGAAADVEAVGEMSIDLFHGIQVMKRVFFGPLDDQGTLLESEISDDLASSVKGDGIFLSGLDVENG